MLQMLTYLRPLLAEVSGKAEKACDGFADAWLGRVWPASKRCLPHIPVSYFFIALGACKLRLRAISCAS